MPWSSRSSMLAVGLFAMALYAVTIGGTFVYDDVAVVDGDPRLGDWHRWGEFWTGSYNNGVDNLYRPLVSMSYAVAYWLHPHVAWWYHACNALLHGVVSAMVVWVAFKLLRALEGGSPCRLSWNEVPAEASRSDAPQIAVIAGLLFAAHPIHVEAVANIVGRAELMCAIATLGAIGLAIAPLSKPRVFGIWICCLLAILCKEQGILTALMVGVVRAFGPPLPLREGLAERAFANANDSVAPQSDSPRHAPSPQPSPGARGSKSTLSPLLFALMMANIAGIVFIRENVIHLKFWWDRSFLDPWIQPLVDSRGIDRALVPITIVGRYLGLLVAPITLRIDYGGLIVPGVFDPRDPFFWLGVVAIALFFALWFFAWRMRDRFLGINLALFAISYALVSNIPTIIGVNVAERLMYLPSIFFVMIVARLLVRLPRRAMTGVVTLVVVLFSIRTVTYAWQWNDRLRFYEYEATVEPRSMKAALLAMQENADRHDFAAAEKYGRHAVEIDPLYDDAWLRLAGVLIDQGDLVAAREAIDRAKAIPKTNPARFGKYERLLADASAMTRP